VCVWVGGWGGGDEFVCGCRCGKKYVGLFLTWKHSNNQIINTCRGFFQSIPWVQKPQSAQSGLNSSIPEYRIY